MSYLREVLDAMAAANRAYNEARQGVGLGVIGDRNRAANRLSKAVDDVVTALQMAHESVHEAIDREDCD